MDYSQPTRVLSSVLVTGGAGFIGSHVVERMHSEGRSVVVVDDLSTGSRSNVPKGVALHNLNILNPAVMDVVASAGVRCIIHCAAQPSVAFSMLNPVEDLNVNLLGTMRMLEAGRAHGVERFIFMSSGGAVYGETSTPADEHAPLRPASYYAVHKLGAEFHTVLSGLSYAIVRPANVYGPRQRSGAEGGVVPIIMGCARDDRPFTVYGDGEQERDFVYIQDVAAAIIALADHDQSGVWNVGTGSTTTVNQLTSLVESVCGVAITRSYLPERIGDVYRSCLNGDKLRRELNWRPRVSLEDGLAGVAASLG